MADLHPSDSPDVVGPTLDVARIQTLLADAAKRLDEHSKVESRVMCGCNHVAKKLRALSASLTQLQEERERLTRERLDAFLGGYCCCLSAALNGDDGTSMSYIEAVAAAGAKELLAYAKREDEMELPRIIRAVAEMRARKQRERKARANG